MAKCYDATELKELMNEARNNASTILEGIVEGSKGDIAIDDLSLTFSADEVDYYYDNVNFTICHKPSGVKVFAWFHGNKWEVKPALPRFRLSSAATLTQLMPYEVQKDAKPLSAGFGADAACKDWSKFGRGIWSRVFADTLANWHLVTEKQAEEAAIEDKRADVIHKLEARGWVPHSTSGFESVRMSKRGAKMDISVDEFGNAKMTYAYASFDPMRLADFLEAEGRDEP